MKKGTTRTPKNKCLDCGYKFDAAADPFGKASPKAGDISVCLKCGHLMAFNADATVRPLTGDEMVEIAGDSDILKLQKARGAVMKP